MRTMSNTARAVNATGLPLFAWADERAPDHFTFQTLPPAARRIATHFGVPPTRARLLAELAGFSLEVLHV